MAEDQTVIDHLLLGRQALERDVDRLNAELQRLATTIEQLDAVIDMVGASDSGAPQTGRRTAPLTRSEAGGVTVNTARGDTSATKAAARSRKPRGNAPKSIRVHVLEMLAAEDRDWSLSEIIERIHGAGIQAHDDAVRSITIKLMKDGRVERIGRGQYRLARRGSRAAAVSAPADSPTEVAEPAAPAAPEASAPTEAPTEAPVLDEVAVETSADVLEAEPTDIPSDVVDTDTDVSDADEATVSAPVDTLEQAADTPTDETPADDDAQDEADRRPYTPPLNLGQPWR